MYLDNRGFVTTGVGNLLSSGAAANTFNGRPLQWEQIANGALASPSEVAAEFERVRSDATKEKIPRWQVMGGGAFIQEAKRLGIVTLQLTDAAFGMIFNLAMQGLEGDMKGTPGFEDYEKLPGGFPADAQMGIISVIWANGAGPLKAGGYLRDFTDLCKARQWGVIATQEKYKWSNIRTDRNRVTKKVFENAQTVEDQLRTMPSKDVTIVSPPFSALTLSP
jgi:hypothetical protein